MRHLINDTYRDGYVKVSFCVHCGCDDVLELLDGECSREFIDKNDKKVDKDTELK